MYGGGENSGNSNTRNITNKDTLHISPHIAAHKSSGSSHSSGHSGIEISQEQENQTISRLAPIQSFASNVPGYRVGIPTSAIFTEPFQHHVRTQSTHLHVPTIFTLPPSKAHPQDLSAHTNKLTISENEIVSTHKPLPHIHTVGGSNLENITGPLFVPVSDRSPTCYRLLADGTISITSQHQAVLVPTSSVTASMPNITHSGPVTSHAHGSVGGLPEAHLYLVPHEIQSNNYSTAPEILPEREAMRTTQLDCVKQEEMVEQKDLVHQALQAAVVHNSHKNNTTQDVIDYNYGTDDIQESDDCLVHDDIICHSTFCPPASVKTQELLLMNINMNSGHQNSNKMGGSVVVGSNMNESPSGGQVVVLEPATSLDEAGNIIPPIILSSRRRRTKLSEEAQALRRDKIANRMREKRANETEKQKEARRMREAERMRKKRAQEDENSKERRRREAAERARLRRAKLSNEERELERKKAAARMRLRRQNENEEQKRLRRIKAAERMRKRRSVETPEERATRKLNIAMRMKVKRQRKEEGGKEEKYDVDGSSMESSALTSEEDKRAVAREINSKQNIIVPDTNGQYASTGHLVVSSSLAGVPTDLTLLHNEPQAMSNSHHLLQGSIISAVELSRIAQPLPLERASNGPIDRPSHSSLHKSVVVSTEAVCSHSQMSQGEPRSIDSIVKTSNITPHISTLHHLPHLLHHLTPHQDQHHHQHFVVPHQSQHQQSQPLQLRHQ